MRGNFFIVYACVCVSYTERNMTGIINDARRGGRVQQRITVGRFRNEFEIPVVQRILNNELVESKTRAHIYTQVPIIYYF